MSTDWKPKGIKPYYEDEAIFIICGDCREIVPQLGRFDLLLTDPPYGMNYDPGTRVRRRPVKLKGLQLVDRGWTKIYGEDAPFDPKPWLKYPKAIFWGANNYADDLPRSNGWLVWDKRDGVTSDNSGDCELAWTSFLGSVRMHRQLWRGIARAGAENIAVSGSKLHPHQKPLALMLWCLSFAPEAQTILDPFAGSCTTGRAAKDLGRKCVLIEKEEKYCEIGAQRMRQEVLTL